MGRNFQILIWTAFANIATQCSFNANKFLTEIFNSQTFVTKWLKHRIEQPVIQDRAPEGQIPGLFDCCHCFHQLLIVSMIASFICWLLSGASQLVSVYYSCFISRSWKQPIVCLIQRLLMFDFLWVTKRTKITAPRVFSSFNICEGHSCLEFRLFYMFSNHILVVKPQ